MSRLCRPRGVCQFTFFSRYCPPTITFTAARMACVSTPSLAVRTGIADTSYCDYDAPDLGCCVGSVCVPAGTESAAATPEGDFACCASWRLPPLLRAVRSMRLLKCMVHVVRVRTPL